MRPMIYWVPEDCMFENDGDCLDKFPELGAAALVYSQSAYEALEAKCSKYEVALKFYRDATTYSFGDGKSYAEDMGKIAKEALE